MQITTNNQWRDFTYRHDVPEDVLANQFDYLDEEDYIDGFFCYRGIWYHTADFMKVPGAVAQNAPQSIDRNISGLANWHGYASDSFFSGVLIRLSDDGEQYQVATYCS